MQSEKSRAVDDPRFPPPWVEGSLENLTGGATNVLPVTLLQAPLRVEVTPWPESHPSPDTPETLVLLWDGSPVGEPKQWEAPIAQDDYFIEVPTLNLREDSTPTLIYRVTAYNGVVQDSAPLTVTLDLTGPALGGDRGALIFDSEVLSGGVTADYLKSHDDALLAIVPDYQAFVPGDRICWYWDVKLYEDNFVAEKVLLQGDLPVTLVIPGDIIRERLDGPRFAHYRLYDYAGNPSTPAEPKMVELQAATTPVPRDLQWPDVAHATGTAQQVVLDPNKRMTSMRVGVPAGASLPGEGVEVYWGEPGAVGSYLATAEVVGAPGQYDIPLHRIAPHSGKVLSVYYHVTEKGGTVHASPFRYVNVLPLQGGFPRPQIPDATHDAVYLSRVPEDGLVITLDTWRYIHTDHRVTLVVSGVDQQGKAVKEDVLTWHAVTLPETQSGLGLDGKVKVSKSFLSVLKLDQAFSVNVHVSFDQGQTWPELPNFPIYNPALRA